MLTQATPNDYWISPTALYIEPNALSLPDYVQASCVSNAQILVYMKGIPGLDFDAGHNYRRWPLSASPTAFTTHTPKYIYVAIPRPTATVPSASPEGTTAPSASPEGYATIVFPSTIIDIYGKNEAGEQIGSEQYYYIYLQASLTSSGDNGTTPRTWTNGKSFSTGMLSSDESIAAGPTESEWYEYSRVSGIVTFLKDLTFKLGQKFLSLFANRMHIVSHGDTPGSLTFGEERGDGTFTGGTLTAVTDSSTPPTSTTHAVTPKYLDDNALSKSHDDTALGNITFEKNVNVLGSHTVKGLMHVTGRSVVGTSTNPADQLVFGNIAIGTYSKGVSGSFIDLYGNAEFESIVARRFLEVPELRFNRTTITVGNKWQTVGAGIIDEVWTKDTAPDVFTSVYEGIASLKLESGEVGAIALGDKCQGVFHLTSGNDTTTSDPKNGNFQFAGFTTIYFVIQEVYTAETLPQFLKSHLDARKEVMQPNQFFRYELRAATCRNLPEQNPNRWTNATHPQPTMHFACYANAVNSERQASRLTTTTYQLHLAGMTGWTYDQSNIRLIVGWLDGFTLMQRIWDKTTKQYVESTKQLTGEGIAAGNMYMWGNIDQFDRAPSIIAQQLYFKASTSEGSAPAGIIVADNHSTYQLNGWQTDPITANDGVYPYQQWLYTYNDGTYDVSDVIPLATKGDKGDKGDPGEPGTGIDIKGTAVGTYDSYQAYNADTSKQTGLYLVPDKQRTGTSVLGAFIYQYDASSGTTVASSADLGDTYYAEDNGHMYVAVDNGYGQSTWKDCGEIRGRDAVLYTLDIPTVIQPGTTTFPITVVKTEGDQSPQRLTYAEAAADGIRVSGLWVFYNASLQEYRNPNGAKKDTTYTIALARNGSLLQSYKVQCVGSGINGYEGCIVRRSEWQTDTYYRNDSTTVPDASTSGNSTNASPSGLSPDGKRYIDEVSLTDLATGNVEWYVATEAHNGHISTTDNRPVRGGNDYWTPINDLRPLRTSFADIMNAFIQYLQVNQIVITNPNTGRPYGAFGASTPLNPYPLWFGGEAPQEAITAFRSDGGASLAGGSLTYDASGNVDMTGTVNSFDINHNLVSSYNGNGDGTIVYYYAALERRDPTTGQPVRTKMKEDVFTYNEDGSIKGMQTRYYNTDGTLRWYINENGQAGSVESYWEFFTGGEWRNADGTIDTSLTAIALYHHPLDDGGTHMYNNAAYDNSTGYIDQSTAPSMRNIIPKDGTYTVYGKWRRVEEPDPYGLVRIYRVRTNVVVQYTYHQSGVLITCTASVHNVLQREQII